MSSPEPGDFVAITLHGYLERLDDDGVEFTVEGDGIGESFNVSRQFISSVSKSKWRLFEKDIYVRDGVAYTVKSTGILYVESSNGETITYEVATDGFLRPEHLVYREKRVEEL